VARDACCGHRVAQSPSLAFACRSTDAADPPLALQYVMKRRIASSRLDVENVIQLPLLGSPGGRLPSASTIGAWNLLGVGVDWLLTSQTGFCTIRAVRASRQRSSIGRATDL